MIPQGETAGPQKPVPASTRTLLEAARAAAPRIPAGVFCRVVSVMPPRVHTPAASPSATVHAATRPSAPAARLAVGSPRPSSRASWVSSSGARTGRPLPSRNHTLSRRAGASPGAVATDSPKTTAVPPDQLTGAASISIERVPSMARGGKSTRPLGPTRVSTMGRSAGPLAPCSPRS